MSPLRLLRLDSGLYGTSGSSLPSLSASEPLSFSSIRSSNSGMVSFHRQLMLYYFLSLTLLRWRHHWTLHGPSTPNNRHYQEARCLGHHTGSDSHLLCVYSLRCIHYRIFPTPNSDLCGLDMHYNCTDRCHNHKLAGQCARRQIPVVSHCCLDLLFPSLQRVFYSDDAQLVPG